MKIRLFKKSFKTRFKEMNKGVKFIGFILLAVFIMPMISAAACGLEVSLINQDPYPAIPGEYVDVVFQITGVDNPECGVVEFEVKESFPFTLDPTEENPITVRSGVYDRKFSSFYIAPYEIRVDADALDGDNPIEVFFSSTKSNIENIKEFNINVQDTRVDFEVFIKDYNPATKIMTFELLNIEESDIEALTVEIPKQDNIEVKGPNRNIVGDLDSNEYTTAEFEAISKGGAIELKIIYTDSINVRRTIDKTVYFEPSYFEGRNGNNGIGIGTYIFILVVVGVIGFWWYRRRKKRKHRAHSHR
jgi:hypothetical protein